MALQYSTTLRNAQLDQIETVATTSASLVIYTGSPPATCASANSGTALVTINCPADLFAAASSGSKALAGTWSDASADNTGTAGHFRLYSSQATKDGTTCIMQGTVTATGGGGDLTLDNASITAAQTVTITTFTITAGNA